MVHEASTTIQGVDQDTSLRFAGCFDDNDLNAPSPRAQTGEFKLPARMRGEVFDQKTCVTYAFHSADLVGALRAIHKERSIVVQFDVSERFGQGDTLWTPICNRRAKFAMRILQRLRKQFEGVPAMALRLLSRAGNRVNVEGPFVPHQPGIALSTLLICVPRETNFDDTYQSVMRFLELHPSNDYREESPWFCHPEPPRTNERPDCGYPWTKEEFDAIERMARLEAVGADVQTDLTQMAVRREYNESILAKVQTRHRVEEATEEVSDDASDAANGILRAYFTGRP